MSTEAHFDIHASIVFQLGESLIRDDLQALLELAKNSYDADATYVTITVDSKEKPPVDSVYAEANGYIVIEDNGTGMTRETLERGWLIISNSMKREQKRRGETSKRGRTPLGDKGLGRLSAQRLGYNIEIITRTAEEEVEHYVGFSWREFETVERLTQVPVKLETRPAKRKHGTRIVISELRNPEAWTGPKQIASLETGLSTLLSPFRDVEKFRVHTIVNGNTLNLAAISESVRNAAQIRYRVDYENHTLKIHGRASLEYFRPQKSEESELFQEMILSDLGERFFQLLNEKKPASGYNLRQSSDEKWFVEFSQSIELKDILKDFPYKPESVHDSNSLLTDEGNSLLKNDLIDPGPFHAEVDYFNLESDELVGASAFDSQSDVKKYIKGLSGIRVYRDGFGIRVDQDWLGLGGGTTSGRSFYGLRPKNAIGYVAITAAQNVNLRETTDREGFEKTPYFETFYAVLQRFVKFSADLQSFLRRSFNEMRTQREAIQADLPISESKSPEKVAKRITSRISKVTSYHKSLQEIRPRLTKAVETATLTTQGINTPLLQDLKLVEQANTDLAALSSVLKAAQPILNALDNELVELDRLGHTSLLLENQIEALREQAAMMYETVSLGLVAEALSHEINHIADRMLGQSQSFIQHLRNIKSDDSKSYEMAEYINTAGNSLRKQLSHLSPSLRYLRDKRDQLDVLECVQKTVEYFSSRLSNNAVEIVAITVGKGNFRVLINQGKLIQVLDNLLLNSEYWVLQELKRNTMQKGLLTLEIDSPKIRIFDNGQGIDPSVEFTLFEPFVTTKDAGRGRGLGLFIAQQLLEPEGCTVDLLPERNAFGRRYKFEINLAGVLDAAN
jgi:signal transduction histidine kinase